MKKYIVELTTEERSQLNQVIQAERMGLTSGIMRGCS